MKFMYAIAAIIYWPVWLTLRYMGYPWLSILAGLICSISMIAILWKIEFGTWKFWE